jgi:hypothetical protein
MIMSTLKKRKRLEGYSLSLCTFRFYPVTYPPQEKSIVFCFPLEEYCLFRTFMK